MVARSTPRRYVGGLGSSGAGAAIAEKAETSPFYGVKTKQNVVLAGHQAIRLVQDLEGIRSLTYLVGDDAAFWVLDFSADRDKFSAFVPLFERSAHSLRLRAAR